MADNFDDTGSDALIPKLDKAQSSALRRRMLLASLGKGSIIAAAAAGPISSLATQSSRCKTDGHSGGPYHATISGMQSVVQSLSNQWPVSCGYGCGHYGTASNWPGYSSSNDQSCRQKVFNTIFGGSGGYTGLKCKDIVSTYPSSAECRWVLAYLNADTRTCNNTKYYYPYSQSEVVALYKANGTGGQPSRTNCQTIFGLHMENMS